MRVRDEDLGSLYLIGHDDSRVSAADEELLLSLGATAGVAILNARLFAEATRREDWMRASTEITRQLLADEGEEPLRVIARRLQQIAAADAVNVVLPSPDGERLMVEVATGAGAEELTAMSYPIGGTVSQTVLATAQPVLIDDLTRLPEQSVHLTEVVPVGPLMVLPLVGAHVVRGALVVGRLRDRARFTTGDLEMATTFANHAAVALELADARAAKERVALLEDRDRIARDLHDHVMQRLFGAGLTVESIATGLGTDPRAGRLGHVVRDIDETIQQIRTSIFQLRGPLLPSTSDARSRLLVVAADVAPLLGFDPAVRFTGPVDAVVPEAAVEDLLAVLREALTNVGKHAGATCVTVSVTATTTELDLQIVDDGVGIGGSQRRSGLENLRQRAVSHGGHLTVTSPAGGAAAPGQRRGTSLRWTIPL
jgi:signal transduction histidine kinase